MWYNKLIKEICGMLICFIDRVIEIQITAGVRTAGAFFKWTFIFMSSTAHYGITKRFFRTFFVGWFKNQTLKFFYVFYRFVIVRIDTESHELLKLFFRDDIYGHVMGKIAFLIYHSSLSVLRVHKFNSWRRAVFWRSFQGVFYNIFFLPFYYHFRDIRWTLTVSPDRRMLKYSFLTLANFGA